jgi:hypothetical protein
MLCQIPLALVVIVLLLYFPKYEIMFYIENSSCISPQQSYTQINLEELHIPMDSKLTVAEPGYEGIPTGILRRMGKAVRIAVGAAIPLFKRATVDGVIIGTANGGMEDCIKFLNQIIEYNEGMLTPTNFVQSTPNAIAAQLGLMTKNKGYNITHVHRGHAFENALLDADMLLTENPGHSYLLGGVDEISTYNFNIEYLAGWYRNGTTADSNFYAPGKRGSIAGEGAAMFVVGNNRTNALASVAGIHVFHSSDEKIVAHQLQQFLDKYLKEEERIDLLLSGENGDNRLLKYYETCEACMKTGTGIARFKHMMGEQPSVTALAVWLATYIFQGNAVPAHMFKYTGPTKNYKRILIYNNYKGLQHSIILMQAPDI